jgi:hypothetical protein
MADGRRIEQAVETRRAKAKRKRWGEVRWMVPEHGRRGTLTPSSRWGGRAWTNGALAARRTHELAETPLLRGLMRAKIEKRARTAWNAV